MRGDAFPPLRDVSADASLGSFRKSGYYSSPGGTTRTTTTYGASDGRVDLSPLLIPVGVSVDRIAIEITSGGTTGCVTRLGIYASDGTGPTSLVVDGGTVDCTTIGIKEATISAYLAPGLYWLAAALQGNPGTSATYRMAQNFPFGFGANSGEALTTAGNGGLRLNTGSVTGAFPATCGTPNGGANPVIAVVVRFV